MTFERRKIDLRTSAGVIAVDAECCGALAAHKLPGVEMLSGLPAFGITIVPNGLSLSRDMGFDTIEQAKSAVRCLAAFPVDWSRQDVGAAPYLAEAVCSVMALCGCFIIQNALDGPVGGRA